MVRRDNIKSTCTISLTYRWQVRDMCTPHSRVHVVMAHLPTQPGHSSQSSWAQSCRQPLHALPRGDLWDLAYCHIFTCCLETSRLFFLPVLKCLVPSTIALYSHSVSNFSLLWASFKLGNLQYKRKVYSVFSFDNPTAYSMFIYHWLESGKMCRIIRSLMWRENFIRDLWMQWYLKMNRTWVFLWLLPSAGSPQALRSPSLSLGLLILQSSSQWHPS